jgi:hypothetical protein
MVQDGSRHIIHRQGWIEAAQTRLPRGHWWDPQRVSLSSLADTAHLFLYLALELVLLFVNHFLDGCAFFLQAELRKLYLVTLSLDQHV